MKKILMMAVALVALSAPAMANDYVKATLSDKEQREHYDASKTAAFTVKQEDCGKTFTLNLAAGFDVTFPNSAAAFRGCELRFIYETALTGDYYRLVPADADTNLFKGILIDSSGGAATSTTGTDAIRFVSANALAGDKVELYSDGNAWFLEALTNASGAIDFSS